VLGPVRLVGWLGWLDPLVAPLCAVLETLNRELATVDKALKQVVEARNLSTTLRHELREFTER
jgi:hypothetical protein